jgi:hypothetical protein
VTREADHLGAGGRLPVPPPDWAALALKPDLKPRDDQGNPADGSVDEHIGDDRKGAQTQNLLHDDIQAPHSLHAAGHRWIGTAVRPRSGPPRRPGGCDGDMNAIERILTIARALTSHSHERSDQVNAGGVTSPRSLDALTRRLDE